MAWLRRPGELPQKLRTSVCQGGSSHGLQIAPVSYRLVALVPSEETIIMKSYKVQCSTCGYPFKIVVEEPELLMAGTGVGTQPKPERESFTCPKCKSETRVRVKQPKR
jgi:hypothetical protein